ncbi:hypothetical protein OSTOST_07868, partial [Ostertagia ostertagi]
GVKRTRTESPGTNGSALSDAVNLLVTDDKLLPAHLKTILGHLLEKVSFVDQLVERNRELEERLSAEVAEKNETFEGSGVFETISCQQTLLHSNRIAHDAECIRKLFDFLSIDCTPITSYRMGKPNEKSPRLIKVVLPSRYFRRVLLERAPRLKTYQTGGVYIRPSLPKAERDRLRALREEKKRLATITSSDESSCLLMGDFNFSDIEWSSNPCAKTALSRSFLNMLLTHNYVQYVDFCTRKKNVLDLVLCNNKDAISDIAIGAPLGSSDHATITFSFKALSNDTKFVFRRDYRNTNYDDVVSYLRNIDWLGSFGCCKDTNEMYELFIFVLNHCIQLFVPVRKVSLSIKNLPAHLYTLFVNKTIAYKKAMRSNNEQDWKGYQEMSTKFEKRLFKYNCAVEKKIVESCNKSYLLNYIRARIRSERKICTLVKSDGSLAITDVDKAETFADEFQKVYISHSSACPVTSLPRSFDCMRESVLFVSDDILNCLLKWPSSVSFTPD